MQCRVDTLAFLTAVLACGVVCAEQKSWIGTDQETYDVATAWSPEGVPSATDDILIDGKTITYSGANSGDWMPQGVVTIQNGALWRQTGIAWPNIKGNVVVDGATLDFNEAGQVRTATGSSLVAQNQATIKVNAQLSASGNVEIKGQSTLQVSGTCALSGGNLLVQESAITLGSLTASGGAKLTFDHGADVRINTVDGIASGSTVEIKAGAQLTLVSQAAFAEGVVVDMAGGSIQATSSFYIRESANYRGGVVRTSGELQFARNVTIDGTEFTCSIAACQTGNGGPLNIKSGLVETTSPSWDGFYANGSYINFIPTGSGAFAFAFEGDAPDAYARYFSGTNPKLRLDDEAITREVFNEKFDVTVDTEAKRCTIALKQAAGAPVFEAGATKLVVTNATGALLTTRLTDTGSPVATVTFCYGATDGGKDLASWEQTIELADVVADQDLTLDVPLEADRAYYWALVAANDSGAVWAKPSAGGTIMTAELSLEAPLEVTEGSSATITLTRPTNNNLSALPLSVAFTLSGTAVKGTHYTATPDSVVTFPSGSSQATITLETIPNLQSTDEPTIVFSGAGATYLQPTELTTSLTIRNLQIPGGDTNVWLGVVSTDSTNPENWSKGALPDQTSVVLFSPLFAQRGIDWKATMPTTIAGWVQPHAFSGNEVFATFETTLAQPLTVTGDVILDYGFWTSGGPASEPIYALNFEVGGNFTIGSGAQLSVGNDELNVPRGRARGYYLAGPGHQLDSGASFAGEGASGNAITYGSILNPLDFGSSGKGDSQAYSGAGIIRLQVAENLVVEGAINAMGFGWSALAQGGASSGGSINLTAAKCLGNGSICADGGRDFMNGSGSGGRIRIRQTASDDFASFTGSISAKGRDGGAGLEGANPYDTVGSSAGTIVLQTAKDVAASGRVLVKNSSYRVGELSLEELPATHLPAKLNASENLSGTTWEVSDAARVRLTQPLVKVQAISLASGTKLLTDGNTLQAASFIVDGEAKRSGTYTAVDLPEYIVGEGSVVVGRYPTIIFIQ